jgi:hypothetical protein
MVFNATRLVGRFQQSPATAAGPDISILCRPPVLGLNA